MGSIPCPPVQGCHSPREGSRRRRSLRILRHLLHAWAKHRITLIVVVVVIIIIVIVVAKLHLLISVVTQKSLDIHHCRTPTHPPTPYHPPFIIISYSWCSGEQTRFERNLLELRCP
jgi:hypothetical protein